jgi:hypothetical protein
MSDDSTETLTFPELESEEDATRDLYSVNGTFALQVTLVPTAQKPRSSLVVFLRQKHDLVDELDSMYISMDMVESITQATYDRSLESNTAPRILTARDGAFRIKVIVITPENRKTLEREILSIRLGRGVNLIERLARRQIEFEDIALIGAMPKCGYCAFPEPVDLEYGQLPIEWHDEDYCEMNK